MGNPVQNAFIESFDGKVRDECFEDTGGNSIHSIGLVPPQKNG